MGMHFLFEQKTFASLAGARQADRLSRDRPVTQISIFMKISLAKLRKKLYFYEENVMQNCARNIRHLAKWGG